MSQQQLMQGQHPGQGQQQGQLSQQQQQQQQGQRLDQTSFMKHQIIYANTHCAILKLLSSFSGSDYFELLNSIYTPPNKHGPKYFINPESEEINKAIVIIIARTVHLTCNMYYINR